MKFSLAKIDSPDRTFFAWPRRNDFSPLPPVALLISGKFYKISNFSSRSDEYLCAEADNFEDAINLSVSIKGEVSLSELFNVAALVDAAGAEPEKITAFSRRGIKGKRLIEALVRASRFPEELLSYFDGKNASLKIISLLTSLPERARTLAAEYVKKENPSNGDFAAFVNGAADFREYLDGISYEPGFRFEKVKSPGRSELEKSLRELDDSLGRVSAVPADFFETARTVFSFGASDTREYLEAVAALEKASEIAGRHFDKLELHDIR